jgi:DNA-binding transcriptional regulator YhcF (GntR family)
VSGQESGAWLRERRLARGWGKAEMARRLHTAMLARGGTAPHLKSITRSIGGWEGGGRYPHDRWAAVICEVLGIALQDFPAPPGPGTPPAVTADPDTDDARPWMRVTRMLLDRIGTGELRPGDRMPRPADVGHEAGVSVPTVRLAYAYLEGRGVIGYRPGTGYHVSGGHPDDARHGGMHAKAEIREDAGRRTVLIHESELAGAR